MPSKLEIYNPTEQSYTSPGPVVNKVTCVLGSIQILD